jgi:hypothetical protein
MSYESKIGVIETINTLTAESAVEFVDSWGLEEELDRIQYETLYDFFVEESVRMLKEGESDYDYIGFGSIVSTQDYSVPSNALVGWIINLNDRLGLKRQHVHDNDTHGLIHYLDRSVKIGDFAYSLGYRTRSGSGFADMNTFELGIVRSVI